MDPLQRFSLRFAPFHDRPDPRLLFRTAQIDAILTQVTERLHSDHGTTVIFGNPGLGKTLIARCLCHELHSSDHVLLLTCPDGEFPLLREVSKGFGVNVANDGADEQLVRRLTAHLMRTCEANHHTMLILDRAELLKPAALRQLTRLLNLEYADSRLVQIVIVGRGETRGLLSSPEAAEIYADVQFATTLQPFTDEETAAYIRARLTAAAGDPDLFTAEAADAVHAASAGNPRHVNDICAAALRAAADHGDARIDASLIRSVAAQLPPSTSAPIVRIAPTQQPVTTVVEEPASVTTRLATLEARLAQLQSAVMAAAPTPSAGDPTPADAAAKLLADRLQAAQRFHDAIQRLVLEAEDKIGRLDSHNAAAAATLQRLFDANVKGHALVERLDEPRPSDPSGLANDRGGTPAAPSAHNAAKLVSRAAETLDHLEQSSIDAARLTDRLLAATAETRALHERLEDRFDAFQSAIDRGQQIIDRLDERDAALTAGGERLRELESRLQALAMGLHRLQRNQASVEQSIREIIQRPDEAAARAADQAATLESLCSTARKVGTELARTALHAHQQAQQLRTHESSAGEQLTTLRNEVSRAAASLRTWVEQAALTQERLSDTLAASASVDATYATHPLSRLEEVAADVEAEATATYASVAATQADGQPITHEAAVPPGRTPPREPVDLPRPRVDADEIAQLIADAKRAAVPV